MTDWRGAAMICAGCGDLIGPGETVVHADERRAYHYGCEFKSAESEPDRSKNESTENQE